MGLLSLLASLAVPCIPTLPSYPDAGYSYFKAFCKDDWNQTFEDREIIGDWKLKLTKSDLTGDTMLFPESHGSRSVLYSEVDLRNLSSNDPFILQYEVRIQNATGYSDVELALFEEKPSSSSIEPILKFGPIQSDNVTSVYLSISTNGNAKAELNSFAADMQTHLYTLILRPNGTFTFMMDEKYSQPLSLAEKFPSLAKFSLQELFSKARYIGFDLPAQTGDAGINNLYIGGEEPALIKWNKSNFGKKKAIVCLPPPPDSLSQVYGRLFHADPITTIAFTLAFTLIPIYCFCIAPFTDTVQIKTEKLKTA